MRVFRYSLSVLLSSTLSCQLLYHFYIHVSKSRLAYIVVFGIIVSVDEHFWTLTVMTLFQRICDFEVSTRLIRFCL